MSPNRIQNNEGISLNLAVLRFYQFKEVTITGVTPPEHGAHAAVEPTRK